MALHVRFGSLRFGSLRFAWPRGGAARLAAAAWPAVTAAAVWMLAAGHAPALAQPVPDAPLDAVTAVAPEVLARNKRNVIAFYELAFNQSRPREAMEKYAGAQYIQHNPEVPDGKEGFIRYFEQMAREYPGKKLVIRRVLAEGDRVIVHCWSSFPGWLGPTEFAAIDIFRVDEHGKIVEHWDVLQRIPRRSANGNSMF